MPFISVPKYLGLMKNDGEYCTVSKPGMFYINFYSSQQAIEVCKRRWSGVLKWNIKYYNYKQEHFGKKRALLKVVRSMFQHKKVPRL